MENLLQDVGKDILPRVSYTQKLFDANVEARFHAKHTNFLLQSCMTFVQCLKG
jgi:hypothetical protein